MDPLTNREPALPNGSAAGRETDPSDQSSELRGALIAGLIGAVVATAGYVIYNRLEDEHKMALRKSVTRFVEERVNEVRAQLKL